MKRGGGLYKLCHCPSIKLHYQIGNGIYALSKLSLGVGLRNLKNEQKSGNFFFFFFFPDLLFLMNRINNKIFYLKEDLLIWKQVNKHGIVM